jgi:streptogramin lyase
MTRPRKILIIIGISLVVGLVLYNHEPPFGKVKEYKLVGQEPYGVLVEPDGNVKFYDKNKKFYTNTEEIKTFQTEWEKVDKTASK